MGTAPAEPPADLKGRCARASGNQGNVQHNSATEQTSGTSYFHIDNIQHKRHSNVLREQFPVRL